MVKKITTINAALATLMMLMFLIGANDLRLNVKQYGWKYTIVETITSNGHVWEETKEISLHSQIPAIGFLGLMSFLMAINAYGFHHSLILVTLEEDTFGLTFPHGPPEKWYAEGDMINRVVEVGLNEHSIRIPLNTILDWFKEASG